MEGRHSYRIKISQSLRNDENFKKYIVAGEIRIIVKIGVLHVIIFHVNEKLMQYLIFSLNSSSFHRYFVPQITLNIVLSMTHLSRI